MAEENENVQGAEEITSDTGEVETPVVEGDE